MTRAEAEAQIAMLKTEWDRAHARWLRDRMSEDHEAMLIFSQRIGHARAAALAASKEPQA